MFKPEEEYARSRNELAVEFGKSYPDYMNVLPSTMPSSAMPVETRPAQQSRMAAGRKRATSPAKVTRKNR